MWALFQLYLLLFTGKFPGIWRRVCLQTGKFPGLALNFYLRIADEQIYIAHPTPWGLGWGLKYMLIPAHVYSRQYTAHRRQYTAYNTQCTIYNQHNRTPCDCFHKLGHPCILYTLYNILYTL